MINFNNRKNKEKLGYQMVDQKYELSFFSSTYFSVVFKIFTMDSLFPKSEKCGIFVVCLYLSLFCFVFWFGLVWFKKT